MKLFELNPFIRYAGQFIYKTVDNPTYVRDCRIFFITDGQADIFLENNHFHMTEGSLFYCNAGSSYNIESEDGAELICLNFDLNFDHSDVKETMRPLSLKNDFRLPEAFSAAFDDSPFLSSHLYIQNCNDYYEDIKRIHDTFMLKGEYYAEMCACLMKLLIIKLHKSISESKSKIPVSVDKVMSYIKLHYREEITNTALARVAGYHEYYLNRMFAKYVGVSIHKYLLNTRIDVAKMMLVSTEMPVSEIYEATGFSSNTHFSNYFKQICGMPPLKYRKTYGKPL